MIAVAITIGNETAMMGATLIVKLAKPDSTQLETSAIYMGRGLVKLATTTTAETINIAIVD